ncbi:MAG: zinc ribbon domain-containing protein [Gemmataceae bacterium]|nr:zinc ribbon domain-containing protein [Gemmataceae bacterium]
MPASICPRCQRANPDGSQYCYFDGAALHVGMDGAASRLGQEFAFPSGRRCRSFEELAQGCVDEWTAARDLLRQGTFQKYFSGIGRHDLARAAQDALGQSNLDIALTNLLGALPVTRPPATRIDIHPRRAALGQLNSGEQRQVPFSIANQGTGVLQGTVSVTEGGDWLKLDGGVAQCPVNTPREQRVTAIVSTQGLPAAQSYLGKLTFVTNGGIVEVPVGFDVVARPFPKMPFQGARTPRELAERMRLQPKSAGPILEGSEVPRWFAANGWKYPVQGTPAKGVAGVQQFFEAMGLSKPPPLKLSQSEVRFNIAYPQTLKFQISLQTTSRKWVYGQVTSGAPWLKVLTPQVSGPQKAAIGLEIDTQAMPGPHAESAVQVVANGGQKLTLRVAVEAQGVRGAAAPDWLKPILAAAFAFFLVRLALLPVVELGGRAAVVRHAAIKVGQVPAPDSPVNRTAGWLHLPWTAILTGKDTPISVKLFNPQFEGSVSAREFRHYYAGALIRTLILWTWWVGAVAGVVVVWRRSGGNDALWGLLAGGVAGILVSATVACLFLVLEIVPHALAATVLGPTDGVAAWFVWIVLALAGWTLCGLAVGVVMSLLPPLRAGILVPVQQALAGLCRLCGFHGLARTWSSAV